MQDIRRRGARDWASRSHGEADASPTAVAWTSVERKWVKFAGARYEGEKNKRN